MGLALLWLSGSEPTVSRSNHSTNMKSSQEGRGNGEGEEIQHLQKCCLAGLLPMPAFNSCTLTAVTWHRIQEGLRCIPAGFTLSAIYQGCVGVCVLNPKGHDAQATLSSDHVYSKHASLPHPSFENYALFWAACRAGGPTASGGSVYTRHARRHGEGTSARPLLLTQPHATQCTCDVAAGVQFKKLLVWSQFGPLTNEAGTSGDVAGDDWAGSLTAGTHRSHLVIT